MNAEIVIIADSFRLAEAVNRHLRSASGSETNTRVLTYQQKAIGLSGDVYRRANLFIVQLMRRYDFGLRAEGVFAAETLWKVGKRALIISGCTKANDINSPIYWDLGATVEFRNQVETVLELDAESELRLDVLKYFYAPYCRAPTHHPRCKT